MYVPAWLFWAIGSLMFVFFAYVVAQPKSDYDFVSPLLGAMTLGIGVAFVVGYLVAS